MAKRNAWLHVDLAGLTGDTLTRTLLAHRDALREQGFTAPVRDPEEGRRAWVELRRLHREHGLPRREVEGTWAAVTRRAWKGRRVPLLSVPELGPAAPEQAALALDLLHGLAVHVVLTVPVATSTGRAPALDRQVGHWQGLLRPGRTHRLPVAPGDWGTVWREYAALAGVDAAALPLASPPAGRSVRLPGVLVGGA